MCFLVHFRTMEAVEASRWLRSGTTHRGLSVASHVAVLSCGSLGFRVARRVVDLPEVTSVTVFTTPYRTKQRRGLDKLRWMVAHDGVLGVAAAAMGRLARPFRSSRKARPRPSPQLPPGVQHLHFEDFHSPDCLAALRSAEPDLGVLAGVYILGEPVFEIPRLGSINLHTGKVPEYRGSAPAFWELYNGESEVGVTVHQVTTDLDAGAIIRQKVLPLDPAPPGDPLEYIETVRRTVLIPAGIDLLEESVRGILRGTARPEPQDHSHARTYRLPVLRDKRELRRRVRQRRSESRCP